MTTITASQKSHLTTPLDLADIREQAINQYFLFRGSHSQAGGRHFAKKNGGGGGGGGGSLNRGEGGGGAHSCNQHQGEHWKTISLVILRGGGGEIDTKIHPCLICTYT